MSVVPNTYWGGGPSSFKKFLILARGPDLGARARSKSSKNLWKGRFWKKCTRREAPWWRGAPCSWPRRVSDNFWKSGLAQRKKTKLGDVILKIHGRGEKDGRENDLAKIAKIVEITISSMRNFLNEEAVLHQNASLIIGEIYKSCPTSRQTRFSTISARPCTPAPPYNAFFMHFSSILIHFLRFRRCHFYYYK